MTRWTIRRPGECGICFGEISAGANVLHDPWRGLICRSCEKSFKSAAGAGRKRQHEKHPGGPAPAASAPDLDRRLAALRSFLG